MPDSTHFIEPKLLERILNRCVGWLARVGIGPRYVYVLRVTGRRTGKLYSTPVNRLEFQGRMYLVGGRGHTAWSRNAAAVGVVTLVRGRTSHHYRVLPVTNDRKLVILRAYLDAYRSTVQRFFDVQAGSPATAFRGIADRHPVFELTSLD